jgi:hypothetical protein
MFDTKNLREKSFSLSKKNLKAKRNEDVRYQNFLFRKNVWFSRKKSLLAKRNKVIRFGYTEKLSKCSLFIGTKVGKRKGPILKDRRFDITSTGRPTDNENQVKMYKK